MIENGFNNLVSSNAKVLVITLLFVITIQSAWQFQNLIKDLAREAHIE